MDVVMGISDLVVGRPRVAVIAEGPPGVIARNPAVIEAYLGTAARGGRRMTDPLLVVEDLVGGYVPEVDILRGVNLTLQQGELVGIIGPNGAGKSTLVKAIFGLLKIRSGTVMLRGETINGRPTHELVGMGIGYVPQRANVFPSLSVEDNLRMGLYLQYGGLDRAFRGDQRHVSAAPAPAPPEGAVPLRRGAPDARLRHGR